jgi:hypothetical protein
LLLHLFQYFPCLLFLLLIKFFLGDLILFERLFSWLLNLTFLIWRIWRSVKISIKYFNWWVVMLHFEVIITFFHSCLVVTMIWIKRRFLLFICDLIDSYVCMTFTLNKKWLVFFFADFLFQRLQIITIH